ncbi:hypothetical protein B0A55_01794 [Friedmanniomyces simplex]|uniref:Uncharacterized protein n=1 Tax=Friedmanniomyces simplex TaxID=329884 RepID=A0A4U0Y5E4_9PEZI|nr:hypothetical protein B0A55_01794 [Friedmanniomyces simplex]
MASSTSQEMSQPAAESQGNRHTFDAEIRQSTVTQHQHHEPALRTRVIDTLNKQCAEKREHLFLRLPQPNPVGHCIMVPYTWSQEEAERYLAWPDRSALPRDLATVCQDDKAVLLWVFDASHSGGKLPELELDPLPELERHPALCAFDMDGGDNIALIPSEFLEMRRVRANRVQFKLKENRGRDDRV